MRIVHFIPSMMGGGAERQLCYLASGLVARGHDVIVGLTQGGPNLKRLEGTGARLQWFMPRRATDPSFLFEAASMIRREGACVVQTWLSRMDIWAGLAAQLTGAAWLYGERSAPHFLLARGWRRSFIQQQLVTRRVRAAAAAVAANSTSAAEWWRSEIKRPIPIRTIPNALPLDDIDVVSPLARADLGVPDDAELILYAGRFEAPKNVPLLVEISLRILQRRPRARLIVAGGGPLLASFERRMAAHIATGRCVRLGYRSDLWSVMKTVDVLLSPSLFEGHPNVVLEAMACGLPVVISDISEHREITKPRPEWLFRLDAPEEAVAQLCDVLDDAERRMLAVRRARSAVECRGVALMAEAYEELYAEVASRR